MKRTMLLRLAALPIVAALGALPVASGCGIAKEVGCPEFDVSQDFGANLEIDANVKTFMQAAGQFDILGQQMVEDVSTACINIATAAGRDPAAWEGQEGSELVKAACAEADLGVQAVLAVGGNASIEFLVEGGECRASINATADCYAQCDVSGQCTPAQLEAKCEPGKLAGKCSGQCNGSCEGGTVQCQGECSATCTGTCVGECIGRCNGQDSQGACDGECEGRCESTCTGTCSGSCEYKELACEGTCHGECTVEFQEPYCEGKFTPPECEIDADCQASCEASVTAQAECTPPSVTYRVVGSGTAELSLLAVALEKNLPILLVNTATRGEALFDTATTLVTSGEAIVSSAGDLTAKAGICASLAAEAAATASLNVKVSVEASASVTSSASAGVGAN